MNSSIIPTVSGRPISVKLLPALFTLTVVLAMLWHGPIAQLAHYHNFADTRALFGMPNGADVLSNAGFLLVGLWGMLWLAPYRRHSALATSWPGYQLFFLSLILTALGSAFYHLAPDNLRLIWDRMPIALACVGLLVAARAENLPHTNNVIALALLIPAAILSVLWWYMTELKGNGDLRPYLLLQTLPLILIPLWQAIYRAPRADRLAFGIAIGLYVVAKVAELSDYQILATMGWISGHSIKHLLATMAGAVLVLRLTQRVREAC